MRTIALVLIPLLAACSFKGGSSEAPAEQVRLQGEINEVNGQLLFRPCQEQRQFQVIDAGALHLLHEVQALQAESGQPLFSDLKGTLSASADPSHDGQLAVSRLLRLQNEGHGCNDVNFNRLSIRASGNEPDWSLSINPRGLLLERPGEQPLALPYMEEQLPDGRIGFSSSANGVQLELWLNPARCIDSMSGSVQPLQADLNINGQHERGCAYFGGARES